MAELTCQFVRPDKLLYEGTVESLILASADGEYGVWPGHAPEIIALGDGVVRLHMPHPENEESMTKMADHARRVDDIDADVVRETRDDVIDQMLSLPEDDNRRAYYEKKIDWCNLLLKQVVEE